MAFTKATKQVAYAKIGGFGPMGSGKTTLMALLSIYLSKTYHGGAPVAFLDTEKGSDFVKPYFDQEGVEFLVDKTRAFVDLRDAHAQALKLGACVLVADSLTHYWQELLRSVKGERKRLDIKLIGEAKERWSEFTENYDRALIHWMVAGRLGYDWENVDIEDEDGNIKNELLKGQSKMKAEGDFSYEPDLVLELSSADDPDAADYRKLKGRIGRAIAEKSLAQSLGQPTLIVLAATILARRASHYNALEAANRQNEITNWLAWFGGVTIEAQRRTLALIEFLIEKAKLFDRLKGQLNERQQKALLRMFKEGPEGFKGGLSAGKYSTITGASPATATRDLADLTDKGALVRTGELRHARYTLSVPLKPVPHVTVSEDGQLVEGIPLL